ncbi:Uncharacterised protein [[Clostridium] symbiosum]|uniref:Lipoprotein n=2 Tax=Clostridium symbiosum TaxID=1512 RepID=A0A6N3EVY5_CLOSY|nr:hypothetical protein [[Clostridium] symbiosum]MDB2034513.1 hypothetical protein [[Clostridium] symbiosum]SUY58022.1 Uncharacterised protein [[Clostridium] symbiosum]
MKRQLKKRQFMKRGMMGIYAAICAGMLMVTGCAGTETNAKTETERIEATERQESNPVITAGKEEMDTFADANDMMKSADLSGTAGECSDTGCVINTSPFADGTSSSGDGGSMTVTYTEDTVFQKGTVKSDGSSYSLEDSEKDRIGDSDFVLCFGKQQADGSYLADRIIMIVFN